MHIPVTVYPNASNPTGFVVFSQSNYVDEEVQVIGVVNVHLHDIVDTGAGKQFALRSFDEVVGTLVVDVRFYYGMYGFGHSTQLVDQAVASQGQVR